MGGDNDRVIGQKLYHTALAWDYLQPLFNEEERRAILSKAEEYLQKIYDFTLLQRAYMGYPTIDPHSLGALERRCHCLHGILRRPSDSAPCAPALSRFVLRQFEAFSGKR